MTFHRRTSVTDRPSIATRPHVSCSRPIYRLGLALLAAKRPDVVLACSSGCVFGPNAPHERTGDVDQGRLLLATWIREEKLDTILPNEPKITSGKIVAHSDRVLVAA